MNFMGTYKWYVGIKLDYGCGAKHLTANEQSVMIQFSHVGTDIHKDMALNTMVNIPMR